MGEGDAQTYNIIASLRFHLPFCATWSLSLVLPPLWHTYASLLVNNSLLAFSDELFLLPVIINSELCWDLGSSTYYLPLLLEPLGSTVNLHLEFMKKRWENRIFTHNESTSHVGLASSEFSTYN